MVRVGLQPVCPKTGKDKMSAPALTHRIIECGPFAIAFAILSAASLLPWTCAELRLRSGTRGEGDEGSGAEVEAPRTRNKVKFSCPQCGVNAWGKPTLKLACINDHEPAMLIAHA